MHCNNMLEYFDNSLMKNNGYFSRFSHNHGGHFDTECARKIMW